MCSPNNDVVYYYGASLHVVPFILIEWSSEYGGAITYISKGDDQEVSCKSTTDIFLYKFLITM